MVVPNNEGMICDAVVRVLEKWTGETRADVRHPDKEENHPPVDMRLKLGAQEYAIEHTRIEPYQNQIRTNVVVDRIIHHIRMNIPHPFPGHAYYELQFPIDVSFPRGKARRDRALKDLVKWVLAKEQILRDRNSDRILPVRNPFMANDSIQGASAGFDCEFNLRHWPIAQFIRKRPGTLSFRFTPPNDIEGLRIDRLQQAFSRKCPKLQECKAEGARTVLVLESSDPSLNNFEFRGNLLPSLLTAYTNAPDEIFLLETHADLWCAWLIKRDDDHWPDTGMPEMGQFYYDTDTSPLPGIPEWLASIPQQMRDALKLDDMYTPFLPGWAPADFKKEELDDLAAEQDRKKDVAA